MEFLATMTTHVPEATSEAAVDDVPGQSRLLRLSELPVEGRALGPWSAGHAEEMGALLESLPLVPWAEVETAELAPHPDEPGQTHA